MNKICFMIFEVFVVIKSEDYDLQVSAAVWFSG